MIIKSIKIGPHLLQMSMQDEAPFIEWQGQAYNHIWVLCQQLPILSESAHLKAFAEVSNFLWKGIKFQFIDQITKYQEFYREQVKLEKQFPQERFQYQLTQYKIFDVTGMHEPKIETGQCIYYVYQTETALPYRVVCPFPYLVSSAIVHYQILPLQKTEP